MQDDARYPRGLQKPNSEPADPAASAARFLARWLDERYLDPILGLIFPGFGDLAVAILGLYPVILAHRQGAPRLLIARMLLNLSLDVLVGLVPLLGDLGDFFVRANTRNLVLLRTYRDTQDIRVKPGDVLVLAGAVGAFVLALSMPIALIVLLWSALGR